MSIEYDEKGKFYTDVITKMAVPAIIQTTSHLVRGQVHVRQGERLKDEVGREDNFLAVTNAEIQDASGKVIFKASFLAVQKMQIVWVMPDEQAQ